MISRSKDFWLVAFFFSKFSNQNEPPVEVQTRKWNEAYRMFYDTLGQGRTIISFEHSIKNARDSFDSHFSHSGRIGWRDKERKPRKLEKVANEIFVKYSSEDRKLLWDKIEKFSDKSVLEHTNDIEDLISIQESEKENSVITKTEGGKKVIASYKYERSVYLRNAAIRYHGYECFVCGFNYEKFYGEWGKGFAEVHHITLLSQYDGNKSVSNVKEDLVVLCANCHRMIHRKKGITLTVEELKSKITNKI